KAALNKLVTEDELLTRKPRLGKTPIYGFNKDRFAELITENLSRTLRKGEQPPSLDAGGAPDAGGTSNAPSFNAGGAFGATDPPHLVRQPPASDAPLTRVLDQKVCISGKSNFRPRVCAGHTSC